MNKIDLKKELKEIYSAPKNEAQIVKIPAMSFLVIEGKGDPNTSKEYKEAVESLFALSYKIKFTIKKGDGIDYAVMPLEGLWWTDDMNEFTVENKDIWKWKMMIMQPKYVTKKIIEEARTEVEKKKDLPALSKIKFEKIDEGLSAQIMHIGPYSEEAPTIEKLHAFIKEKSYRLRGKHHEIYLGDPRRADPKKLKTVLRQPIVK